MFSFLPSQPAGLVFSGGGARSAFQIGVLEAWREVLEQGGQFQVQVGLSSGALLAARLFQSAPNLARGLDGLEELLGTVRTGDLLETRFTRQGGRFLRMAHDLLLSSLTGRRGFRSLLDMSPASAWMERQLRPEIVEQKIRELPSHALVVPVWNHSQQIHCTCVWTSGPRPVFPWNPRRRRAVFDAPFSIDLLRGAMSPPLLTTPVQTPLGLLADGGLQNVAPLSPAVRMGARRIVVLDTRGRAHQQAPGQPVDQGGLVRLGMQALLYDAIDADLEAIALRNRLAQHEGTGFQPVEILHIAPPLSFGEIAWSHLRQAPRGLQFLCSSLGAQAGGQLLSHLLWEGDYLRELQELGRAEGRKHLGCISSWLLE